MQSLGLKFPFAETYNGGIIGYTEIDADAIRANLTAFLTLKRGQRVMNNSMYSPLYDYIMEPWDEISESSLSNELNKKIAEFFPEIDVKSIDFVFDETQNLLSITVSYIIIDLKIQGSVSVSLAIQL